MSSPGRQRSLPRRMPGGTFAPRRVVSRSLRHHHSGTPNHAEATAPAAPPGSCSSPRARTPPTPPDRPPTPAWEEARTTSRSTRPAHRERRPDRRCWGGLLLRLLALRPLPARQIKAALPDYARFDTYRRSSMRGGEPYARARTIRRNRSACSTEPHQALFDALHRDHKRCARSRTSRFLRRARRRPLKFLATAGSFEVGEQAPARISHGQNYGSVDGAPSVIDEQQVSRHDAGRRRGYPQLIRLVGYLEEEHEAPKAKQEPRRRRNVPIRRSATGGACQRRRR